MNRSYFFDNQRPDYNETNNEPFALLTIPK